LRVVPTRIVPSNRVEVILVSLTLTRAKKCTCIVAVTTHAQSIAEDKRSVKNIGEPESQFPRASSLHSHSQYLAEYVLGNDVRFVTHLFEALAP